MMFFQIFFALSFLFSFSNASDFCVGDLNAPQGPAGYSCKKADAVSVKDFVFSGLRAAGNTSNLLKVALTPAFSTQFPGVNGLDISLVRVDYAVGGRATMHTHPEAAEILVVIQGTLYAGFISTTNKVYTKTLEEGDVMTFPKGLMHFQINVGKSGALAFAFYSSASPGVYLMDNAWFANDMPTDILQETTFLDPDQIKKLKGLLGGTG
ncbi:ARABIDOPSIS THALIANA GERMIN 3, germin 3, GERMIN-LIKE PROTEIN 3 [Hibiscus trionum]|uniref:Germin-like protein n=1 Tax=Hibiscus trionum TaxID=183268 RepID=A0A9W7IAY3_HIBTR|nr:ARABIDOPSIS THALIANA GERMIN 3, germin 3, GERMIN-LIKE PROTEIN 3 [Hibiscus trionum]